ncbi:hypothetical protein TK50_02010 [Micromonospora haikouensis]|uniref:Uncharacterized protein n=1 Tax=Micromonospora haikouensis TaxID=686309 RepID=A0A0D0WZR4_9ACTN|nr:hypothetical protein TK50_02010 [Micromonospora haikouensis]
MLQAGFCVDTDRKATRTTVQYIKSGGGTVTLRFGWQIISPSDTVKETYWDEGAFTQSAGQTKYYRFEYPTWRPSYDSTYKCGRGIMKDQNSGTQYVTKLVCNM